MFECRSLELVHWDFWQRFTLPLDSNIVTIVGPNGSGKTTLLDSLRTLLALDCSAGRDYKRYVRRNGKAFAWLRGVVGNRRGPGARPPFFPVMDEAITLGCRIHKKGGDWIREYAIEPGDVAIESLEKSGTWLGVTDYRLRLEGAGLTRAIKRVLSLEQGDTDKLCEYTPKQLLELVFDVFGDKEVLDNYLRAKSEQHEIARELESLEVDRAALGTRLREAEGEVNSYQEWCGLKAELSALEAEWLPRVELAELVEVIQRGRSSLTSKRRDLTAKRQARESLVARGAARESAIAAASEEEARAREECRVAEGTFLEARDRARDGERLLVDRERLERLAREQAAGVDVAELTREQETLRQRVAAVQNEERETRRKLEELVANIAAWRSGGRIHPPFVAEFRAALDEARVENRMLVDIVEVTDEEWQSAVEAVLAPFRYVVVLADPNSRRVAWEIGERVRYRHFVVPERGAVPPARRDSLLEVVRFSADPPPWVAHYLNDIQRVKDAAAGTMLAPQQAWITRDGYYRERRGARYCGVEPREYAFGEAARRRLIEEGGQEERALAARLRRLADEHAGAARRLREIQALLAGVDAVKELSARAAEFAQAERHLPEWRSEAQRAAEELVECQGRVQQAMEQRIVLGNDAATAAREFTRLEEELTGLGTEYQSQRRDYVTRALEARAKRRGMPTAWYSREGLAEAKSRFDSAKAVGFEIGRLKKRLEEGRWVTDERVIAKRDKLSEDHERLGTTLAARREHHTEAVRVADNARAAYINVLRATVRQYGRNVRLLGELASIGVEIDPPHLENDDVVLSQAGLVVKFDFDQKGFIGLNDGEASGGQQVMKSFILLVGLMMDDARPGGFVFIDEPFAHLDIFNIDKVGAFLDATRAQYILTTPNTHNINVFRPSDLTLVTGKRKPKETWAPPVAFLRRDRMTDRPPAPPSETSAF
jgi:chromosome segregation ATPase